MTTATQETPHDGNSIKAAIARSLARGIGLYFSRPVRLFRPSKVSGWTTLHSAAQREGSSLSPRFLRALIKEHGALVVPRHFLPPLLVNTFLGAVLFSSYTYTYDHLFSSFPAHSSILIAGASGGVAGAAQAIIAAPAENVRIVLERGTLAASAKGYHSGWTEAWKEVFRGTEPFHTRQLPVSQSLVLDRKERRDIRELRKWMSEVRDMAGRGWDGWGWGFAKDICGFSIFFAIFDLSRQTAHKVSIFVENTNQRRRKTNARIAHGCTLVTGGVLAGLSYELIGRPFDSLRRLCHLEETHFRSLNLGPPSKRAIFRSALQKGPLYFFRSSDAARGSGGAASVLRTLARVGPWGVGFLVWEAFGSDGTASW